MKIILHTSTYDIKQIFEEYLIFADLNLYVILTLKVSQYHNTSKFEFFDNFFIFFCLHFANLLFV